MKKGNIILVLLIMAAIGLGIFLLLQAKEKISQRRPIRRPRVTEVPGQVPAGVGPTGVKSTTGTAFAMAMIIRPDISRVCDYEMVALGGRNLKTKGDNPTFDPQFLDRAKSCGTKVMVALNDKTERILQDDGTGIDLDKFREAVSFFKGKIDPYVNDGVVVVHGVIDEPHDCKNDWGGDCPSASEVDQASAISKEYWPSLPTAVNTVPNYLESEGYTWMNTDIIQFQYAYHKYQGDMKAFVDDAVALNNAGRFRQIAWSIQAKSGGCETFQGCPMTPDQIKNVSQTMCDAKEGKYLLFVHYDTTLLSPPGVSEALEFVKDVCS